MILAFFFLSKITIQNQINKWNHFGKKDSLNWPKTLVYPMWFDLFLKIYCSFWLFSERNLNNWFFTLNFVNCVNYAMRLHFHQIYHHVSWPQAEKNNVNKNKLYISTKNKKMHELTHVTENFNRTCMYV